MSTRKVLNNFISNMLLLSPRNPKIHLPRYNDTGFLIYDKNNCYILPYYELAPYFKVHFYSTNSKNFNSNSEKFKLLKPFSSGYAAIEDILKSDESDYDKQLKIENTIRYLLRLEIDGLLKHKDTLNSDDLSIKMILNEFNHLKDDIHNFIDSPIYSKNKTYIKHIKSMDPALILSIVLSKVIPFVFRHSDHDEQPIISLFKNIGNSIVLDISVEQYKKDLKNKKIKQKISLEEYRIKNNFIFDETDMIKLGLDLVTILSENSNLIEMQEIKVDKNLTKRIIVARDGLTELLDKITLVDSEELPMIIKPIN